MLNKKNGNGKRVRTPLTPSGANLKNKKPQKDKEAKVTTLLFAGGLAVFAVMLLAVVFMFAVRGSNSQTVQKPAPSAVQNMKEANEEQVLDAVYLSLFSYGLDKNSIKEKTEVATVNEAEIRLTIDPFHVEEIELKQTIIEKIEELGLIVHESDGITASNSKVNLFIDFIKPLVIQKPKPNSIAFVIDDCGYSLSLAKRLAALPFKITMAVIPYTQYAAETAEIARKNGKTVFLHQPMQPLSYPDTDPGKGAVLLDMSEKDIKDWLGKNVADLGTIDGFNNHMGSALTQDREKMQLVFKYMRRYTDTFVDSYTASGTVAYEECLSAGFRCGLNKKFIDNENTYSYIRSKIIEGTQIARDEDSVIMIGHLREDTVDALEKILPELEKAGYHMVSATELAHK